MATERGVKGLTKYGPTVFNEAFGSARAALQSKYKAQRQALRDWISRTWGEGWEKELKKKLDENRLQEKEELRQLEERLRREAEEEKRRQKEPGSGGGNLSRTDMDQLIGDLDYYDAASERGAQIRGIVADWFRRNVR